MWFRNELSSLAEVSLCVCSLRCTACNAHAPHCHLWPATLYNFFPTLSHKRHDFRGKKVIEHKLCVLILIFSRTLGRHICHSKQNWRRCDHKCTQVKGKAAPLQAWSGPEGSRKLRFPAYVTTAQDSGKVVSLTHRSPLPPGNTVGTHFC